MSYDIERKVLTNKINTESYFGLSPFGLDGGPVDLVEDSGFMTIINGAAVQASSGSPSANCHDYPGVLAITMLTKGERGAGGATSFIDTVIDAFTGLKLDEDGAAPDNSSLVVIDFARNGFVPYVASKVPEAPFFRTVVNAPFVRTERR